MKALPLLIVVTTLAGSAFAEDWPHWRGPTRDGISGETGLPSDWSTTKNVSWRIPMPDRTGATPIIWGETVFLNVAGGGELHLWALDRKDGRVKWKAFLSGGDHRERKQNMSSPSPVTDGHHVWVMTGTGILKSFDFDGNELWSRNIPADYGKFGLNWGYASSPLLFQGALLHAGAARHEDRRAVLSLAHRRRNGKDRLAGRAADGRHPRVPRRLHHARASGI